MNIELEKLILDNDFEEIKKKILSGLNVDEKIEVSGWGLKKYVY